MCRILVTGASGALGNLLADTLEDNGFLVTRASRTRRFSDWVTNAELFAPGRLNGIDMIINCAFPRGNDEEVLREGQSFLDALLRISIENKVPSFINISSQDVYGNFREIPSTEDNAPNPQNAYARIKLLCENLALNLTHNSEINYTNIRLGSLVGPEYPERIINRMAMFALTNRQINVQHSQNVFSFLNIKDAVDGLVAFVRNSNPQSWNEVYNLGVKPNPAENTMFIARNIQALCREFGIDIAEIEVQSTDANISRLMNSSRFYDAAGWEPEISLETSIREIFEDVYGDIMLN